MPLFLKMYILEIIFFSGLVFIQLTQFFSGSPSVLFLVFISTIVTETFFHHNHAPYESKLLYPWKIGDKLIKRTTTQKIVTKIYLSTPFANEPELKNEVKMQQKLTWVDGICLLCLIFLKSPWWPIWAFCVQGLLKGTIFSSIICVILNVELFSRKWVLV